MRFRLTSTIARHHVLVAAVPSLASYLRLDSIRRINGWVGTRDDELARTRARLDELHKRSAELETRNRELVGQDLLTGSSVENVERAHQRAEVAHAHALEAHERAAHTYQRSADAHDAAAERHEQMASGGYGDAAEHLRRAREHRDMSATDRRAGDPAEASVGEV
jgi:hypothetical protein